MINEATLLISEWLKHPTHGVNAILATIPRHRVGGGTDYPKPKDVTIYNDVDDDSVSKELEPDVVPALVVFCDSDMEVEAGRAGDKLKGNGLVVVIAYIVRDVDSWAKARRDGGFTLRAVRQSLNRLNTADHSNGYRKLNDVSISKVERITEQRVAGAVGRSTLAGFVLADLWLLEQTS